MINKQIKYIILSLLLLPVLGASFQAVDVYAQIPQAPPGVSDSNAAIFGKVGKKLENPMLPGPLFCLLGFFCELNPLDNPGTSFGYRAINLVLTFTGLILVTLLIYGGYLLLTSFGNEERLTKAKKLVVAAIIGFLILTLAYAVVVALIKVTK